MVVGFEPCDFLFHSIEMNRNVKVKSHDPMLLTNFGLQKCYRSIASHCDPLFYNVHDYMLPMDYSFQITSHSKSYLLALVYRSIARFGLVSLD